jgi:hypothetical protein
MWWLTVDTAEKLARLLSDDRNILRRKVVVLLDMFHVDGFARRAVVGNFEGQLAKLNDSQVKEVLQVLRE